MSVLDGVRHTLGYFSDIDEYADVMERRGVEQVALGADHHVVPYAVGPMAGSYTVGRWSVTADAPEAPHLSSRYKEPVGKTFPLKLGAQQPYTEDALDVYEDGKAAATDLLEDWDALLTDRGFAVTQIDDDL